MENLTFFVSLSISVLSFVFGRLHGAKTEGEKQGILLNELGNIKQDIKELKTDFKQINVEKIHTELNFLKNEMMENKNNLLFSNKRFDEHLNKYHINKG